MSFVTNDLHDQGMEICDHADAMVDRHAARAVYREAARLEEMAAANEAPGSIDHAILTRSAAWLWVCGYRPGRAVRIARRALRARARTLALRSQGWGERCRLAGELTDVIQHARGHGPRLRGRRLSL